MPGFSFLKGSQGRGRQITTARNDSGIKLNGEESTEKVQRRQSKRDYFRNLLKLSNVSSESKASRRKSGQITVREVVSLQRLFTTEPGFGVSLRS